MLLIGECQDFLTMDGPWKRLAHALIRELGVHKASLAAIALKVVALNVQQVTMAKTQERKAEEVILFFKKRINRSDLLSPSTVPVRLNH